MVQYLFQYLQTWTIHQNVHISFIVDSKFILIFYKNMDHGFIEDMPVGARKWVWNLSAILKSPVIDRQVEPWMYHSF